MGGPIYRAYERRLIQQLRGLQIPRHVGVILDGNRRWARERGEVHVSHGHQRGADKIDEFLVWCSAAGVEVVTLWLLSTDNLSRPAEELTPLLDVIEHFPVDDLVSRLSSLKADLMVIKVPTSSGLLYRLARGRALEQLYQVGTEPPHHHYFNQRSLRHVLSRAGMQVILRRSDACLTRSS